MALTRTTRIVRRAASGRTEIGADVCVLGAGIAGVSAALEAADLGRRVALIDAAPALGGQAVGAEIGTFCGLYSNGPEPYRVTHGIADGILHDLGRVGALRYMKGRRNTVIVQYRVVELGRWIEDRVAAAGVVVLLGAVLRGVRRDGGRIAALELANRYGDLVVTASGFVDASGDAALAWRAGLACRESETPLFGTCLFVVEGVDEEAARTLAPSEMQARLADKADDYGLVRRDGFAFLFPGDATALVNMTHIATPLDPVGASAMVAEGRAQADRVFAFLRQEFPAAFGRARVRSYGLPGVRQTRSIVGAHHLTVDEVRAGAHHADAVARCSWPIELHDRPEGVHWEEFGDDHMHFVPLGSLAPAGVDNLVAAGRCLDADPAALSSVRVMGPCIATGAAAVHALDLAGAGSVHQIDVAELQARLADNLDRRD